jgi:hypothetical protein
MITITQNDKNKLKWRVIPSFSIHIHNKYIWILHLIKNTLGVGNVRKNSNTPPFFIPPLGWILLLINKRILRERVEYI